MADIPTPPIEEQEFIYGLNVVQIEDLRVARGFTRRPASSCGHASLVYDPKERRIWCKDCEQDVEPFDAFTKLAERAHAHWERLNERERKIKEVEAFTIRSRAAKIMDEAWRKRNMVPCCPNCSRGIFPEQVAGGVGFVGKEYAKRLSGKGGAS